MVGRPGQYQFSFNAGELAPAVWGNTGLKQFYAGAALMQNAEPVPQGGFRAMARSRYRANLPLVYDTSTGNPAVRCFAFTVARTTAAYMVVLTPTLATIFKNGVQVAQISTPYQVADLPLLKRVQRFDTMLIAHPTYPIGRILRNGSDTSWSFDSPPFTNVPNVALSGDYTSSTIVEVWIILLQWPAQASGSTFTVDGKNFVVSIDGQETNAITIDRSHLSDVMAVAIQSAINELPTIDLADPGVDLEYVSYVAASGNDPATVTYSLTFTGGTNAGANFVVAGRAVDSTYVSVSTYRKTEGVPGGEPLFSSTRGYPACARFYQDRLALGGFAAKTSAFGMSQTAEYFNLNIRVPSAASSALLINLDTDGSESIVEMMESKHFVLFTTEADYFISDRAVSASAAPNIVQSSTHGCSNRVSVVKQEAGLVYVNRDETIVFAAQYDAVSDAYVSSPLSLLSSHLVFGTRDASLQKSFVATDGERYWLTRDDGTLVVGVFIRNQDVTAFVRWVTDGTVQAAEVDGDNIVHLAVQRMVDGSPQLFLETIEEGLILDGAVTISNLVATAAVTGLTMHDGATVWAIADGFVEGPYVVAGAAITLRQPASVVTVGRWTPLMVETLPLVRDVAAHTVLKRPARVFSVVLDLIGTTSLAIGANDQPARGVDLITTAQPTDTPPVPFTGEKKVTGLRGFSADGQVVITQLSPGTLQVRDITVEAKI